MDAVRQGDRPSWSCGLSWAGSVHYTPDRLVEYTVLGGARALGGNKLSSWWSGAAHLHLHVPGMGAASGWYTRQTDLTQ